MAITAIQRAGEMVVDKVRLRHDLETTLSRAGLPFDRNARAERSRALMLADGVRPEDNIGSREIVRMRDE